MRSPAGGRDERARPKVLSGERCGRRQAAAMSERDRRRGAASEATDFRFPGTSAPRPTTHAATVVVRGARLVRLWKPFVGFAGVAVMVAVLAAPASAHISIDP